VDDVIKGWRDQLEAHAAAFVGQAAVLQRWDAAVLSNRQVRPRAAARPVARCV
jgi:hypothetical protein